MDPLRDVAERGASTSSASAGGSRTSSASACTTGDGADDADATATAQIVHASSPGVGVGDVPPSSAPTTPRTSLQGATSRPPSSPPPSHGDKDSVVRSASAVGRQRVSGGDTDPSATRTPARPDTQPKLTAAARSPGMTSLQMNAHRPTTNSVATSQPRPSDRASVFSQFTAAGSMDGASVLGSPMTGRTSATGFTGRPGRRRSITGSVASTARKSTRRRSKVQLQGVSVA